MSAALDWIVVPLSYPFMQRALIVAVMVGAVCAVLSCYLVLKGWSLMGDAISHAVLPGIVLAYVLGLPLAVGAFAGGLSCAVLTGYLKESSRVKEDTVMGVVFSGMFGFGLVIFTKVDTDQHLLHILFGNMLGVTSRDLVETAVIAGGTLFIVLLRQEAALVVHLARAVHPIAEVDVGQPHALGALDVIEDHEGAERAVVGVRIEERVDHGEPVAQHVGQRDRKQRA
jgi:manganese/iron transport system permease protein